MPLIRLEEERVDAGLGKTRRRDHAHPAEPARREPLLRTGKHAFRHQVVLIEQHDVGVHRGQLASAVGAAEVDVAMADLLEALADGPRPPRRRRQHPPLEVGAVADRSVEPGLREIVDLGLRRHHEEHVAAVALARVRRPEGGVDQVLGDEDLRRLLDDDEGVGIRVDRLQRRDEPHRRTLEEAMGERPIEQAMGVAARQLPLRALLQAPPVGGAPRR